MGRETVLLLYDGRQGLHGFPVDAGLQGDTVMMGGGLIGGTGYPERSVGLRHQPGNHGDPGVRHREGAPSLPPGTSGKDPGDAEKGSR